jgi:glycosyltransferase involved in cell wall biosynthesis
MSTGPAGIVARYLALDTGLPLVASVHRAESPAGGSGSAMRDRYRRWYFRGCDGVLVPSVASAERFRRDGRSTVWPRGVDASEFTPLFRSNIRRDEWHVSARRPAILVAGPHTRERGADLVHAVSSWLYERRIAHRFVVVGDGPLRADVSARCPDACVLGRVPQHELPSVFASADVLFYPADEHSGCTLLLEAQASGLPVVVSRASNANENIRHGESGYVCRARDVSELGTRLALLLVDHAHREEMGHAARRYAMSRSWPASLAPVYALYRALAATTSHRRAALSSSPPDLLQASRLRR